jgi:hypothetical protein
MKYKIDPEKTDYDELFITVPLIRPQTAVDELVAFWSSFGSKHTFTGSFEFEQPKSKKDFLHKQATLVSLFSKLHVYRLHIIDIKYSSHGFSNIIEDTSLYYGDWNAHFRQLANLPRWSFDENDPQMYLTDDKKPAGKYMLENFNPYIRLENEEPDDDNGVAVISTTDKMLLVPLGSVISITVLKDVKRFMQFY